MSDNPVALPTCLPFVASRCHRCAPGRIPVGGAFPVAAASALLRTRLPEPCAACGGTAELNLPHLTGRLRDALVRRGGAGGPALTGRPAWQSPYGPPPGRAHRGRWAPAAVLPASRSAVRPGHLCGRCD